MSSKIFPIRLPDELRNKFEAEAQKRGISVSALIKERVSSGIDFPPFVSKLLDQYSKGLDIRIDQLLTNIVLSYFARREAHLRKDGKYNVGLFEFTKNENGEVLSGEELFETLVHIYMQEIEARA